MTDNTYSPLVETVLPESPNEEQAKAALDNVQGPFCIDCKHVNVHERGNADPEYDCSKCWVKGWSLVDGSHYHYSLSCRAARYGGPCGREGKFFEPKTS